MSAPALTVLVPVKLMPPLPALTVTVAALSAPVALIPLVLPASLKVNDEPELAPRFIVPVLVSAILTAPVELALSVPALVEDIAIPPVPADAVNDGVVSVPVEETPPAALSARSVIEPVAV